MPLRLLHDTVPTSVESEQDVHVTLELGLSLSPMSLGRARYEKSVRDLGDYFYYVGAVYPGYFRPLQSAIVTASDTQLANFQWTFPTWLYLLQDAPDTCVDHLARRLATTGLSPMLRFTLEQMLAGICSPSALAALADYVREMNSMATFEDIGFWIPEAHEPAVPRFMLHRLAAETIHVEDEDHAEFLHPIGLPLSAVMADAAQDVVTWHYCSLDLANLSDLPVFPASRLHLVSPPHDDQWTVYCASLSDGRYTRAVLSGEVGVDPVTEQALREQAITEQSVGKGHLLLIPYDDRLIYCNSHVELTPGVVGDVGGPPIGVYPNPRCIACNKLMFHVCTMRSDVRMRKYGEGFRSLYICETCGIAASHATPWN